MDLQKFYRLVVAGMTSTTLALSAIIALPSAMKALTLNGQNVSQIYQRSGPSINRKCSPTESSSDNIPWSPANPNMVIVDYKVVRESLWSRSGYSISEVPADFDFQSYSEFLKEFDQLIEAAGKNGNQEYEARFKQEKRELQKLLTRLKSSHGSIVLKWHCEGDGWFGGRGKVDVAVNVDLMSLPERDKVSDYLRNAAQLVGSEQLTTQNPPDISNPNRQTVALDANVGKEVYLHPQPDSNNLNHLWKLKDSGNNEVMILNDVTGVTAALDANHRGQQQMGGLYMNPTVDPENPNQRWEVRQIDGDYYLIINKALNKALDANGGRQSPYLNSNVDPSNHNLHWRLTSVGDYNMITPRVAEVCGGPCQP